MALFATLNDLALRLPGTATSSAGLTAKQSAQGTMLLQSATDVITDAVDRDATWANALSPVPAVLRAVCLEVVARVMQNPDGARSQSETLGQWSYATSYTDAAHGFGLTDREVALCRRAVLGQTCGSAHLESVVGNFEDVGDDIITGWIGG